MTRTNQASRTRQVLALALLMLQPGCAGAMTQIKAENLKHPVSLTQAVLTEDGRIVLASEHHVAGHFERNFSAWSILWTLIQFSPVHDISGMLESEIAKHGGDAIVNLKISVTEDYGFALTSLIPVFPHAVHYTIEGDVVRLYLGGGL